MNRNLRLSGLRLQRVKGNMLFGSSIQHRHPIRSAQPGQGLWWLVVHWRGRGWQRRLLSMDIVNSNIFDVTSIIRVREGRSRVRLIGHLRALNVPKAP